MVILFLHIRSSKLDVSSLIKLRSEPLRQTNSSLMFTIGKLAKYLRMLGFDSLYQNNFEDDEIIEISVSEKRIILTPRPGNTEKQQSHPWLLGTVAKAKSAGE